LEAVGVRNELKTSQKNKKHTLQGRGQMPDGVKCLAAKHVSVQGQAIVILIKDGYGYAKMKGLASKLLNTTP